jgi:hypothetical protein
VIEKHGTLRVIEMPPPQDLPAAAHTWPEQVKEWFVGHAPGTMAAALRIALGDWDH